MDLISVIVPIYNSELYIRDCVGSVLRQTYTHFELILVDDGSTDNCKEICENYVKQIKEYALFQMCEVGFR